MTPKFKIRQLDQNAIPTTSLADMMFQLLIFFILTATLTRVMGVSTDVPAGAKGQSEAQEKAPTITLHDDRINVDGQEMTMAGLREYIQRLRLDQKTGEAKVVIVSTAGSVTYQAYYEAIALIQSAGGVVAFAREEEDGSAK